MHDLPVSVPAFHGRRRLHGLNVGAVDLKTFFYHAVSRLCSPSLNRSAAHLLCLSRAQMTRTERRWLLQSRK